MKYLILFTCLFLLGCEKQEKFIDSTNNKEFQVSYLFTYDSCKMYRFHDGGHLHYFTKCGETISQQNCGKNCVRDETIK